MIIITITIIAHLRIGLDELVGLEDDLRPKRVIAVYYVPEQVLHLLLSLSRVATLKDVVSDNRGYIDDGVLASWVSVR